MEKLLPSYTIDEWCRLERVSRSKFYELKRKGIGPELMRVGGRFHISPEAAAAWRRNRTVAANEPQTT